MKILLNSLTSTMHSITKTSFLLLTLLVLFSCTESSSSVTPVSDAPTTAATTTLPPIDYSVSGNLYIALVNANLLLEQKTDFGSEARFYINPPLPSGLSLNTVSGSISGTPTISSLPIQYTVTATSDGKDYTIKMITLGVASSPVWVTNVNSAKPYELTAYVEGDGSQQISDWTWSSSDTSLATVNNNGVVTIQSSSRSGFVVITASKDSKSGSISLTVGNPSTTNPPTIPPTTSLSINYNTGDYNTVLVNANLLLRQTTDFGGQARFSVSPALPSGLTIDTTSGSIRGTPTTSSLPTSYTITVTANGKTETKVITLGVSPSQVWVTNADSSKPYELTAYVVGDRTKQAGISWSSSDVSLATVDNNGVVTIQSSPVGGNVVITATTSDGYSQGVSFTVAKAPTTNPPTIPPTTSLSINYNTGDYNTVFVNANLLLRQTTDFGGQARFSVSPALPSGLTIDTTSGSIRGTPTTSSLPTSYTITVTANGKTARKVITLGVAPSRVWVTNADSSKPYELTAYVVGDRTKQAGISWSSSDVSLATVDNNGVVTIQSPPVGGNVVITATTSDGYSQGVSFRVLGTTLLSINYNTGDSYTALVNANLLLRQTTDFGGQARFSVSPALPSGLTIDTTSGNISGAPTTSSVPTSYTITVTANGKTATKVITLGVSPSQVWVTNTGSNPYDLRVYVVGDRTKQAGISWSSSDTSLATVDNNGVVTIQSSPVGGDVVITATTSDGYSQGVSFRVASLSISYGIGDYYIASVNDNLLLSQTADFGRQARFSVSPALPSGLTIDTTSGSISGTPRVSSQPVAYTITVTANGKTATKVITLGVSPSQVWVTNTGSNPYNLRVYVVGDRTKQAGISWSSSDTSLATVDNNGVVTIQSPPVGGNVVITATTSDGYSQGVSFRVLGTTPLPLNYNVGGIYIASVNGYFRLSERTSFVNQARFSISPSLPSGVFLETSTGIISGKIGAALSLPSSLPISYTVTAIAASGQRYTTVITLGATSSEVWVTRVDPAKPYELTAYVMGDSSKQAGVSWSSSDASLATVDNNGVVSVQNSPVGGNVVITATTPDGYSQGVSFRVGKDSATPPTTLPYINYNIGDYNTVLVNANLLLRQTTDFGGQARFSVSPALPSGLTIDTTSGSISGTPTVSSTPTSYTITVTANGKTATKVITLGVAPSPVWVTNVDSAKPYELTAYVVGDRTKQAGISWSSSDTSLATVDNNGVVSILSPPVGGNVVITATTSDGYRQGVSFRVASFSISYGIGDYYIASVNDNLLLSQTADFDGQARFSVSPALPSGLTIDTISGSIRGTPTVSSQPVAYTITAIKNAILYRKVITLGVAPSPVWVFNAGEISGTPNEQFVAYVVGDRSKQAGISWSSSDTSLATVDNNGVVTYELTPRAGVVTITATTSDGRTGSYVKQVVGFSFYYGNKSLYYIGLVNKALYLTQSTPYNNVVFSVTPALPSGLTLDTTSGDISGTPMVTMLPKEYTITARDTINGGIATKKMTIGVAPSTVWLTHVDPSKPYELAVYLEGDGTVQGGWVWTSSDTSLATVDNNGVVTINERSSIEGTVTITASKGSGSFSGRVSFVVPRVEYIVGSVVKIQNGISNVIIQAGALDVKDRQFLNKGFDSVFIPNTVTNIGGEAFEGNEFTNVVIPDSVITIGVNAFANNKLTSVVIPNSVRVIGNAAFEGNELISVVIGNSVKTIGTYAFYNNKFRGVVIPDSVISIGDAAFLGNTRLEAVNLKQSLYNQLGSTAREAIFGSGVRYIIRP